MQQLWFVFASILVTFEIHAIDTAPQQTVRCGTSSPALIFLASQPTAWLCQDR
jgi:hypothetical protein